MGSNSLINPHLKEQFQVLENPLNALPAQVFLTLSIFAVALPQDMQAIQEVYA